MTNDFAAEMEAELDPKEVQTNYARIDLGFVRNEPYFNLHASTPEEAEQLLNGILPVFKKFKAAIEVGKAQNTPQNDVVAKQQSIVETCPKCGGELEEKTSAKGKKYKKCKNGRWDFTNKVAVGCDYVMWMQ